MAAAVWWAGTAPPEVAGARLLEGRLWVDRMPSSTRDMVRKFAVVRSVDHGPFGVAERGSVWRHRTEVFQWSRSGSTLRLFLPQDRRRVSYEVKAWRCDDAPAPFELCLELRGDGNTRRMYSRDDWTVTPRPGGDIIGDALPKALGGGL